MSSPTTTKPIYEVLLVEDDFIDQENVRRALNLSDQNFQVTTRLCLQEAVYALRRGNCFDVILLDLTLPDSYGVDTIVRMLEEFSGMPIIVLSGAEDETLAQQALEMGVDDYLVKGATSNLLLTQKVVAAISHHSEKAHADAATVAVTTDEE